MWQCIRNMKESKPAVSCLAGVGNIMDYSMHFTCLAHETVLNRCWKPSIWCWSFSISGSIAWKCAWFSSGPWSDHACPRGTPSRVPWHAGPALGPKQSSWGQLWNPASYIMSLECGRHPRYQIHVLEVNPCPVRNTEFKYNILHDLQFWVMFLRKDYGAPISRYRIFILLVKTDLMINAARRNFKQFADDMASDLQMHCSYDWYLWLMRQSIPVTWHDTPWFAALC